MSTHILVPFDILEIRDLLGVIAYYCDDYGDGGWEQIIERLEEYLPEGMQRSSYTHPHRA
jgi:hypothetical protein